MNFIHSDLTNHYSHYDQWTQKLSFSPYQAISLHKQTELTSKAKKTLLEACKPCSLQQASTVPMQLKEARSMSLRQKKNPQKTSPTMKDYLPPACLESPTMVFIEAFQLGHLKPLGVILPFCQTNLINQIIFYSLPNN